MINIGYCQNCRNWFPFAEDDNPLDAPDGWGLCALADSEYGEPDYPITRAYAVDNNPYLGNLLTAPDFGCVQFEAKK